ncbi:hypothetical protein B9Z39_09125 [Limnohabitans sp. JirII-29]|uniref:ATPase, T2SS/T4P/T4SS family n=1 Tax=Limnohabitans sp. JirII-29 TaxID=1835756 RepID=UPI000D36990B|nr:ATPase, T2SS/T4P/T4SS family [Limnohabitans sp. JirII-29]PUE27894.1 hypothetical protein B9Z39_09125 [Limnohabitans sp. JirII-29]
MFAFSHNKEKSNTDGRLSRLVVRTLDPTSTETAKEATQSFDRQAWMQIGTYRFAKQVVERVEDMAHVPFEACLNAKLSLSSHLYVSVAIIQASKVNKKAVLLVAPSVSLEEINSFVEILSEHDWSLPDEGIGVWRAAPSILIAVNQGHMGNQQNAGVQQGESSKSALWQSFVDVTQWAFDQGANDIDFAVHSYESMSQVAFKIDGRYLQPERWRLPTDTMLQMLGIAWQRGDGGSDATFQQRIEQQCQLEIDLANNVHVRLRWSGMATDKGPVITLRLQKLGASAMVRTLEGAGYLPWHMDVFHRVLQTKGGLTTLAGTVGSGKSVTTAILMCMLPSHIKKVTFEDPVELDMPGVYQKTIIRDLVQTGEGSNSSFAAGVRALFRSALDVFMLGEIRDPEGARVARAVLESGHSVFTTTHAPSALGIFSKFISPQVGIPVDVLATPGNVRLNVYQTLLAKNCPHCALSPNDYVLDFKLDSLTLSGHQQYMERFERLYQFDRNKLRLRNPNGCMHCVNKDLPALTGFSGRTIACEMVEPDDNMCELLLAGNHVQLFRYWRELSNNQFDSPDFTGKTAMESAIYKASCGEVDPREIERQFESFAAIEHKRAVAQRPRVSVVQPQTQVPAGLS